MVRGLPIDAGQLTAYRSTSSDSHYFTVSLFQLTEHIPKLQNAQNLARVCDRSRLCVCITVHAEHGVPHGEHITTW